jgi:hypothetical protein
MDSTLVSAMAGVLGSLAGGSSTVAAAWVTQRKLGTREVVRAEVEKRESLYGDFIGECSTLLIDSLSHSLEGSQKLVPAYALLNRIRLSASDAVLTEAEGILRQITEQYFLPNKPVEELCAIAHGESADPLKSFSDACRVELKSMRSRV